MATINSPDERADQQQPDDDVSSKNIGRIGQVMLIDMVIAAAMSQPLARRLDKAESSMVSNPFTMISWALIIDVIDDAELQNGVREDGVVCALYSFTRKLGRATAAVLWFWYLLHKKQVDANVVALRKSAVNNDSTNKKEGKYMKNIVNIARKWAFAQDVSRVPSAIPAQDKAHWVKMPHTWNNIDGQDGKAANSSEDVYLNGEKLAHHDDGYSTWREEFTGKLKGDDMLPTRWRTVPFS